MLCIMNVTNNPCCKKNSSISRIISPKHLPVEDPRGHAQNMRSFFAYFLHALPPVPLPPLASAIYC